MAVPLGVGPGTVCVCPSASSKLVGTSGVDRRMVGRPRFLGSSDWPTKITPVTLAERKEKSLPSGWVR